MMRKRGGGNPNNGSSNNSNLKSNGNSSPAVSKLLSQNQNANSNSSSMSYRDGQSMILDVREPILAGTTNGSSHRGSGGADDNPSTTAQLNAKNHRLAKELVRYNLISFCD
jgi:hypothetical protein